ncbi:hypothetical protein SKAU_G00055470 [Synaphobranchus kaupii]|uniref:Uncharacterized protein n=1 Tax=Synaphobranchus kaupii TaxID=118154 RepID=A0A9Q1G4W7_SYNKA|nr:hypothetical protein SKAU_G00055470 [Synaphobranchus kaupii]
MARSSHLILDHVVKAINRLPSGGCIHMDQLFRNMGSSGYVEKKKNTGNPHYLRRRVGSTFVTEKKMLSLTWPTTEAHEAQSKLQRSSSDRVQTSAVSSTEGRFSENKPEEEVNEK